MLHLGPQVTHVIPAQAGRSGGSRHVPRLRVNTCVRVRPGRQPVAARSKSRRQERSSGITHEPSHARDVKGKFVVIRENIQ
jgi:hypothetical protein